MKLTLALATALLCAFAAGIVGLAPIVGAFAAGLVLDPVHFRGFKEPSVAEEMREIASEAEPATRQRLLRAIEHHSHRHVEDLIEPIGHLLVPLFFVLTGMGVNLEALFNGPILLVALGMTVAAFVGKLVSGLAAGPVRKSLVGWGMVPRGEVGLIFATIGRSLGVVNEEVFSVILLVVIFTTLATPPVLTHILRKMARENTLAPPTALPERELVTH
jgi:Kef-type K+ transport system membrane component KefB